nr:hypothetical protein [Tanacetum cinerariifolium]
FRLILELFCEDFDEAFTSFKVPAAAATFAAVSMGKRAIVVLSPSADDDHDGVFTNKSKPKTKAPSVPKNNSKGAKKPRVSSHPGTVFQVDRIVAAKIFDSLANFFNELQAANINITLPPPLDPFETLDDGEDGGNVSFWKEKKCGNLVAENLGKCRQQHD